MSIMTTMLAFMAPMAARRLKSEPELERDDALDTCLARIADLESELTETRAENARLNRLLDELADYRAMRQLQSNLAAQVMAAHQQTEHPFQQQAALYQQGLSLGGLGMPPTADPFADARAMICNCVPGRHQLLT